MPNQRDIHEINLALTPDSIRVLKAEIPAVFELLAQPDSLIEVADKVLGLGPSSRDYFKAIPTTLREGIRAAIYGAVQEGRGVQMQYTPSYDFEVRMWDYGDHLLINVCGPLQEPYARDNQSEWIGDNE